MSHSSIITLVLLFLFSFQNGGTQTPEKLDVEGYVKAQGFIGTGKTADDLPLGDGTWTSVSNLRGLSTIVSDFSGFQLTLDARENIIMPKGNIDIEATLTVPQPASQGMHITGSGSSVTDPINDSSARVQTASLLTWTGAQDGTMFRFQNTINLKMEDMVLHGNDIAGTLVHMVNDKTRANAINKFENIAFYNAHTLIKFGEEISDGTNSDVHFVTPQFTNARFGIEVLNDQGLNYNFEQLSANNVASVIRMTRGNHVNITMANFVETGDDLAGDYSIHLERTESNAFSTTVTGIRFEQKSENFIYASGLGTTKMTGLTEAQKASPSNKIKLRGHKLSIDHSIITSWDNLVNMGPYEGVKPYMTFTNTYFSSKHNFDDIKDMFVLDINSSAYIKIEDCTVQADSGAPKRVLPNFYSSSLLGPVVHEVEITGNNSRYAYLFGETDQYQYNTIELIVGINHLETRITGVESTTGEIIGGTLKATVTWDGTTLTILDSQLINKFSSGSSVFNNASYEKSEIGARVYIANTSGTWHYKAKTKLF